ncbi:hypothetical protein WJX73_009367 [Symbiochloris irregularis]|uniref:Uncharacterized protein n=1 Tax=Symbiochloris irregularis TaxID=706552 RepID=A0AAW1NPD9_9CHLO
MPSTWSARGKRLLKTLSCAHKSYSTQVDQDEDVFKSERPAVGPLEAHLMAQGWRKFSAVQRHTGRSASNNRTSAGMPRNEDSTTRLGPCTCGPSLQLSAIRVRSPNTVGLQAAGKSLGFSLNARSKASRATFNDDLKGMDSSRTSS